MRRWEDESKLHSRDVSPATQMNWNFKWAAGDVFMRYCRPLVTCLLLFNRLSLWTQTSWMFCTFGQMTSTLFFFHFFMKIFGGHKWSGDVSELPSLKWYLIFYTCVFDFCRKGNISWCIAIIDLGEKLQYYFVFSRNQTGPVSSVS